ncbi:hypothetical protein HPB50_004227 [Hyalomma asiaticum]|uniref:Uncharacterized protein n=1 Tax=Hyalomma asiaticum TaxID=266040 RepID=A0ACB7RLF9_HYAAI|nr:hypothetical protein HPB50_004227 [Hyalomma asiaticum]
MRNKSGACSCRVSSRARATRSSPQKKNNLRRAMDYRLTEPRLSPEQQALFMRVGLVLLAVVVVLTTVLLVLTRSRHGFPMQLRDGDGGAKRATRRTPQLCNTTSCRLTATLLKETLDRRRSPCNNLYAYVCSGWMRAPSFTSSHDKQLELLTRHARSELLRIAQRANDTTLVSDGERPSVPQGQQPPNAVDHRGQLGHHQVTSSSAKAALLYSRCLDASVEPRADAVAAFLRDLGIGTFNDYVKYPVELAVKLDFYYDLKASITKQKNLLLLYLEGAHTRTCNLSVARPPPRGCLQTLFDLRRHPTWRRHGGRPVLSMGCRTDLQQWRLDRDVMRREKKYTDFVRRYVGLILAQGNISTDANSSEHHGRTLDSIVKRIVDTEEVVLSMSARIPDDDPDHYHAIVPLLPSSGSSAWLSSMAVNNFSKVAVGHPAFLRYQEFLIHKLRPTSVTGYVAWELARQLGPLADQMFSTSTAEDTCFEAVYRLMPYPSVMPAMLALDSYKGWQEAELTFRDVAEALVKFMKMHGVTVHSENATFTLPHPRTSDLDAFYGDLRVSEEDGHHSFLDAYLIALSQIRSKELLSVVYGDNGTLYPTPPPRKPEVTVNGMARVPLTWLLPPRFGTDAPPSLNYGGFALELVASLLRGASLDRSWLECLHWVDFYFMPDGDTSDWARLVLATEVAAAFVDRHLKVGQPLALPGMEFLSEDMLFFVSACAGMCDKGDPSAPYRCNFVAKSSPNFARAFGCKRGSPLSPEKRCPYSNRTRNGQ